MSRHQLCLAALAVQTLLPFSVGEFFENHADALRALDIPVAKSLHELKPIGNRQSDNLIGKSVLLLESSIMIC
jgi:hypothetical protein